MEQSEFLKTLSETMERLALPYLITGSIASAAYGEPRFTNDVDVVVKLDPVRVGLFCAAFPPPDYYVSLDAARDAVNTRFQFNILHLISGMKIDVIVATDSEFDRLRFTRARRVQLGSNFSSMLASPEDVIIKKLEYFQLGGSEKHLRDIVGILKVQADAIDPDYLAEWIARLNLNAEWKLVTDRFGRVS